MSELAEHEAAAMAARILGRTMYMTLATADADGRPWASPVWFAAGETELLWVSDPQARHSRNLAARPELAIVVFDSTVPIGGAEAVYMEAVAEQVAADELESAVAVFSRRSEEVGGRPWTVADLSEPARLRLYRARTTARFVLGPGDRRVPLRAAE